MSRQAIALALAAALCAPGCQWWRDWRRQSQLDDEIARSRELIPEVPRVRVPGVTQAEGRPVVRLVVTPGVLQVDHVAFLAWVESSGSGLLAGLLEDKRIADLGELVVRETDLPYRLRDEGGYFIEPLYEALTRAADLEKRLGQYDREIAFDGTIDVAVHPDVPFEKFGRVLYTAGQAGFQRFRFHAQGPDQASGILAYELPGFGPLLDRPRELVPCVRPMVAILRAGLEVRAGQGFLGPPGVVAERGRPSLDPDALKGLGGGLSKILEGGSVGSLEEAIKGIGVTQKDLERVPGIGAKGIGLQDPPHPEPKREPEPEKKNCYEPPGWNGMMVQGPQRACPSLPRKAGAIDAAGLDALLRELARHAKQCDSAFLTADDPIPWSDIAPVLSVLAVQRGYEKTQFTMDIGALGEPNCEHAAPPEAFTNP